jgi:hypothetical protein
MNPNRAVSSKSVGRRFTYTGRRTFRFLGASFNGGKGGTAPEALPIETMVPLRRMTSKFCSHLLSGLCECVWFSFWDAYHARVFADSVVDAMNTFPTRKFEYSLNSILFSRDDNCLSTI